MANRIKGITVEIGGDTTKLQSALKDVNSEIRNTQSSLRDVDKLLKLDPGNTELLAQKHKLLGDAVSTTKEKLQTLQTAAEQANTALANGDISQQQYDALQREIIETTEELKRLEEQAAQSEAAVQKIAAAGEELKSMGDTVSGVGEKFLPVTAGVAAIGAAAVKTTADFDSQMSKVAAISGAAGEDFDRLRDKAREMGAATKFSAAEAGEGFEYMAMAGWKTEDMLAGIEPILNLASASGESLGTTSDIVTDALTAFGLTAQDAGHFCDILAAASSNSNTSVSILGESFKYCAPLAGSMGYSAEDVATALGIMANAGIKGSSAGTALRGVLTNLANPSEKMAIAMDRLGVSLDDGNGNMLSLSEIIEQLREGFGNLEFDQEAYQAGFEELTRSFEAGEITEKEYEKKLEALAGTTLKAGDAQKAQTAAMLAGKNGLSGLMALVNASDEDLEKLAGSIRDSTFQYAEIGQAIRACGADLSGLEGIWAASGMTADEATAAMAEEIGCMLEQVQSGAMTLDDVIAAVANNWGLTAEDAAAVVDAVSQGMADSVGKASEQSAIMLDNLQGDIDIFKSAVSELLIQLGDLLMPVVREIVQKVTDVIVKIQGLDEGTKKLVVTIGLIAAAIGPVLIIIGKLMSSVGTIMTMAPKIASGIQSLSGMSGTLTGGVKALWAAIAANPIALVIAAVAAAVAAFMYFWNTSESFRQFWIGLWENIKSAAGAAVQAVASFFTQTMPAVFESFLGFFQSLWQSVSEFFAGIWENMKGVVSTAWETIQNVVQVALMAIGELLSASLTIITLPFQFIWENCKEIITSAWEGIKETVSGALEAVKGAVETGWEAVKSATGKAWEAVKTATAGAWEGLKDTIAPAAEAVKGAVSSAWENVKSATSSAFSAVRSAASDAWPAVKDTVASAVARSGEAVSAGWNAVISATSSAFQAVGSSAAAAWSGIITVIGTAVNSIRTGMADGLNAIMASAGTILSGIRTAFTDVFSSIWTFISGVVNKLKGIFNFSWSLPHIKLPHFSISGSFSLNPPSIPHFSVQWYKKAMKKGMILDSPTIFGMSGSTLLGGGEAGPEAVVGVGSLMSMIKSAVGDTGAGAMDLAPGASDSAVLQVAALLSQYLPYLPQLASMTMVTDTGAMVGQLAPQMNQKLGEMARRERRQ